MEVRRGAGDPGGDARRHGAGATVPATLALTLGAPATFGAFTPGVARDYDASTTANVISTAGDADAVDRRSVRDQHRQARQRRVRAAAHAAGSRLQRGRHRGRATLVNVGGSAAPTSLLSYTGPVSNDGVTVAFRQHIGANDALRTGTYSKTLTFTLATTEP